MNPQIEKFQLCCCPECAETRAVEEPSNFAETIEKAEWEACHHSGKCGRVRVTVAGCPVTISFCRLGAVLKHNEYVKLLTVVEPNEFSEKCFVCCETKKRFRRWDGQTIWGCPCHPAALYEVLEWLMRPAVCGCGRKKEEIHNRGGYALQVCPSCADGEDILSWWMGLTADDFDFLRSCNIADWDEKC